ncbi:MAG: hypothetical protein R3E69_03645 [Steroidobacteraceae bacterium]
MSPAIRLALWLAVMLTAHACFAAEVSETTLRAADAEQMRIIVKGDAKAQGRFMHRNYIRGGPSNRVLSKPVLVEV